MRYRFLWRPLAVGTTIATLLLFPLVNALAVDHGYWLHWRTQDTLETLGAWLMLSVIVFLTMYLPAAHARLKTAEGITALWLLVGSFFFFGAIVKTSALSDFATRYRVASLGIAAALVGLFLTSAVVLLARVHRRSTRPFQHAALMLSPLVLVFVFQLGNAQRWHREPSSNDPPGSAHRESRMLAPRAHLRTVVLLFDELSSDYLYGSEAGALERLPALKRFISESMTYGGAYLPGGKTDVAVPALFGTGRPSVGVYEDIVVLSRNWPAEAVRRGMDVRVFGWYVDYCTGLAAAATRCKAVSLYNPRTLSDSFGLLHPLWTTLNLLPMDMPFGLAKTPFAVRLHRQTYLAAKAWTHAQLADEQADVIYVHVNVPHVPFLVDTIPNRQRFEVTSERYLAQLQYVDAFVADVTSALAQAPGSLRPTRLVVMSDHNVRRLTALPLHERVVFVVRAPGGMGGAHDDRRVLATDLLSQLLFDDGS